MTTLIVLIEELRRDLPMVKNRYDPQAVAMQEAADTAQVIEAIREMGLAEGDGRKRLGETVITAGNLNYSAERMSVHAEVVILHCKINCIPYRGSPTT